MSPSLEHVPVGAVDPRRFESVLTELQYQGLLELIEHGARELDGRVVWNVNSTAKGGGVVELLRPLLSYARGGGVDARWAVIPGSPEFFTLTKRLHNHLHGFDGDGGLFGETERALYETTLAPNADELIELIGPRDVVILHDPQTAGLVPIVRETGASVVWRCHVGLDGRNEHVRSAWDFLLPYVRQADTCVFSREAFVWDGLSSRDVAVIQPSIDAFSPKNQDQEPEQTLSILARAGILSYRGGGQATYVHSDGTPGRVDRCIAEMLETRTLTPDDRLVLQVSRWDSLKDPMGVVRGFVDHIAPRTDADLMLAGPATESVADDPEGASVFAAVRSQWRWLDDDVQSRIHLASLPMADLEENAAVVNALQRHADVVVQKSLAEGFGLTVAEAMWKERPVVASGVGGIQDQIVNGESGLLLSDPQNLAEYGDAVVRLLSDPSSAYRMGAAARERVREHFLGPGHLARYFQLIRQLDAARAGSAV